jgi:type IV secretion system protein VirD4
VNWRVLIDLVVAIVMFTVVASTVFVVGTHHLHMYRYPTLQWWQYLPYYGYRADWDRWLIYGALFGGVPALALFLRLAWELGFNRYFRRMTREEDRPLYGETRPATPEEMRDAGLLLTRKLRFWH